MKYGMRKRAGSIVVCNEEFYFIQSLQTRIMRMVREQKTAAPQFVHF